MTLMPTQSPSPSARRNGKEMNRKWVIHLNGLRARRASPIDVAVPFNTSLLAFAITMMAREKMHADWQSVIMCTMVLVMKLSRVTYRDKIWTVVINLWNWDNNHYMYNNANNTRTYFFPFFSRQWLISIYVQHNNFLHYEAESLRSIIIFLINSLYLFSNHKGIIFNSLYLF